MDWVVQISGLEIVGLFWPQGAGGYRDKPSSIQGLQEYLQWFSWKGHDIWGLNKAL